MFLSPLVCQATRRHQPSFPCEKYQHPITSNSQFRPAVGVVVGAEDLQVECGGTNMKIKYTGKVLGISISIEKENQRKKKEQHMDGKFDPLELRRFPMTCSRPSSSYPSSSTPPRTNMIHAESHSRRKQVIPPLPSPLQTEVHKGYLSRCIGCLPSRPLYSQESRSVSRHISCWRARRRLDLDSDCIRGCRRLASYPSSNNVCY